MNAKDIIAKAKARSVGTKTFYFEPWECDVTIKWLTMQAIQEAGLTGTTDAEASQITFALAMVEPAFTLDEAAELWDTENVSIVADLVKAINDFNGLSKQTVNGQELEPLEATAHSFRVDTGGGEDSVQEEPVPTGGEVPLLEPV